MSGGGSPPEVDTEAETLSDDENAVKIDKPDDKPGIPHDSIATADTGPTKKA